MQHEWGPVYAGPVVQSVERRFAVAPDEWHLVQVTLVGGQPKSGLPSPPSGAWRGAGETENAWLRVEPSWDGSKEHSIYLCPSDGEVTPDECDQVLTCD
ncbi:MAG: hypothetical protein AAF533_28360 [Acidobacteriota bacterium]